MTADERAEIEKEVIEGLAEIEKLRASPVEEPSPFELISYREDDVDPRIREEFRDILEKMCEVRDFYTEYYRKSGENEGWKLDKINWAIDHVKMVIEMIQSDDKER